MGEDFDFDWLVVGSGFGGSVAALRLAERGYSVCVLEAGRRFTDADLPANSRQLRDYFWAPHLGMRGIMRMSFFRDYALLSGAGVGGGSLVYAATLYRAPEEFQRQLASACGEPVDLGPHYDTAERMLGVVDQPRRSSRDRVMDEISEQIGGTCHPTRVGIYRGEPGMRVADPYFDGEGPPRTGCTDCGTCIVACRTNAKNTLDKNYLWLAERRGVRVLPEREVTDVRPLAGADGSDGYLISSRRPGAWVRGHRDVMRARGVVIAAGAIGTNALLAQCRHARSLPALSPRLGEGVRTNAESICAVTARDRSADFGDGVAITSSLHMPGGTHIEAVTYGGAADAMSPWFVPLTGDGSHLTRPLKLLANVLRHPLDAARSADPRDWSRRTICVGAMQPADGAMRFEAQPRRLGRGVRLRTRQDPDNPTPTFLPELHEAVQALAEHIDGIPQSWMTEALMNIPVSGHILGGAIIGPTPDHGVIDGLHRVFGYRNMLVTDGSAVPANPTVNPSLTITALAERAMSQVPAAGPHAFDPAVPPGR